MKVAYKGTRIVEGEHKSTDDNVEGECRGVGPKSLREDTKAQERQLSRKGTEVQGQASLLEVMRPRAQCFV